MGIVDGLIRIGAVIITVYIGIVLFILVVGTLLAFMGYGHIHS